MSRKNRRSKRLKMLESWGFYGTPEWLKLRKRVLSRLGRKCMACGILPKRPEVDHILPRSRYPDLALDIRNLQVLCHRCNFAKGAHRYTDYR